MPWRPLPLSYAVAIYPFQPSTSPAELPLQIGDQLYVIEQGGKDGSWCRGYLVQDPSLLSALTPEGRTAADARVSSGIFPKCCIEVREELGDADFPSRDNEVRNSGKPPAPVPMLKIGDESPTSTSEPLVDEISSCLREWYVLHLPGLVLQRNYQALDRMSNITSQLDYARRELLNDVLTVSERTSLQSDAVWSLVKGNKLLASDVIVRDPKQKGRLLTSEDSAIEMARLQSAMSLLDEPPKSKVEKTSLQHCLLSIKPWSDSDSESTTLCAALYQKATNGSLSQMSETFATVGSQQSKTLLSDLHTRDIAGDGQLFLVLKVVAAEQAKVAPRKSLDRPPSRTDTVRVNRDALLNRRRSSLMFGSKRKSDRPQPGTNGRMTPTLSASPTPQAPEDYQPRSNPVREPGEEDTKPKAKGPPLPRTVGIGVLDVASILRTGNETSRELRIWSPGGLDEEEEQHERPEVVAQFLRSPTGTYSSCKYLPQVEVEMTPFTAPDAETLIKTNPTSMHGISKTQKLGFSEAPTKPRSDVYLTLSRASIAHGASLSHPQYGTVPIRTTAILNLQLTMEVRDISGKRLNSCIYPTSNGAAVTALRTNAVELGTAWDQTLCVRLPAEEVRDAHLVLSVADAPGFPFALAWMPLWDRSSFMKDGKHSLVLHAYDKSTSTFSDSGKGAYLDLPWDHVNFSNRPELNLNPVASLEVETRLVSTEFSQDRVLASLLNWETLSSANLLDMLQKLVFVPEIEIVKQLNEVLNGLFAVLAHKAGSSKFEDLIFNDVVFVLGIVHDRRFNLGPLVERYAEEHFRAPPVAPSLIRSFTRLLQSVSDPQSARDMRALFKVGKQFIKLLVAAYVQNDTDTDTEPDDTGERHLSFKEDMRAVLFGLQMMIRSRTAALIGSKTLLIQNFHSWVPELLAIYSKGDVIKIAIDFVDACEETEGKLALYKLVLILNYTRLERVWVTQEDWDTLTHHCKRWLGENWPSPNDLTSEWRDQVRLCSSIVAELLTRPTPVLYDFLPDIISTYCNLASEPQTKKWTLSLLFPSAYPFPSKAIESDEFFDETLLELSALVSAIHNIEPPIFRKTTSAQGAGDLLNTLGLVRSLLGENVCPASWLSLRIHQHAAAVEILSSVARQLSTSFLPDPEEAETFEMELWKLYFDTLFLLVTSPALTLESFSEQKRRAVWKIAGDVRQAGADLLRSSWDALGWEATADDKRRYNISKLGGFQVQYVPGLVASVIELCLSMHEGLRRTGVEVLQSMIISEWSLSEDLELIATAVIGALNTILKARSSSASISANEIVARKLFVGELLDSFSTIANQPEDALWTALEDLVATVEELIDLLSNTALDLELDTSEVPRAERHLSTELPERSISRIEGKVYGTQALECYKQLAEEYERSGDFKRLAKTYRAIARIHEQRAASRLGRSDSGGLNGRTTDEEEED